MVSIQRIGSQTFLITQSDHNKSLCINPYNHVDSKNIELVLLTERGMQDVCYNMLISSQNQNFKIITYGAIYDDLIAIGVPKSMIRKLPLGFTIELAMCKISRVETEK